MDCLRSVSKPNSSRAMEPTKRRKDLSMLCKRHLCPLDLASCTPHSLFDSPNWCKQRAEVCREREKETERNSRSRRGLRCEDCGRQQPELPKQREGLRSRWEEGSGSKKSRHLAAEVRMEPCEAGLEKQPGQNYSL
jgi:hypothetical protein